MDLHQASAPLLSLLIASSALAQEPTFSQTTPNNPCIGPQVYFGDNWSDSHYAPAGNQREWFFPHWTSSYDVACIENGGNHNHGDPTIWSKNDCSIGCRRLEFVVKGRNHDGDSIGFTLGFCAGDENDPNADYLAVIWNGGSTQTTSLPGSCGGEATRPSGLSLVRVTGIPDPIEFWAQDDFDLSCSPIGSGLQVLAEGTESGWPVDVPQDITVELLPNNLKVWVEGSLEIDRDGDYIPYLQGCFGYYNQSQYADYWGLEVTPLNQVAASWENYGMGFAGCNGVPNFTLDSLPISGTSPILEIGGPNSGATTCCILLSNMSADIPLPMFGGAKLLVGMPTLADFLISLPDGGLNVPLDLVDDSCMAGACLYMQLICLDSCATGGLAFSEGLKVTIGDYAQLP